MGRLFGRLLRALVVLSLVALAGIVWLIQLPARRIPNVAPVEDFRALDQGWGASLDSPARQLYYYTPQGASLSGLRYDWLVKLEQPWGERRFADPAHLRAYGFAVDPAPTAANPDQLPVGFARRFDPSLGEAVVDVSCAACHTGQLVFDRGGRRTALRIDGGAAAHALASNEVGHFVPALTASLASTYLNPLKFRRFGRQVLADRYDAGKWQLHADLGRVLAALLRDAWTGRHASAVAPGPGRTDQPAARAAAVFSRPLASHGLAVAGERVDEAPLRIASLWGTWKHERLGYDGASGQPMAHDAGEALAAGARLTLLDRYGRPLAAGERFRSTVEIESVHRLETALQSLRPPRWPEELLGGIDRAKAEKGRALFEQHCLRCHGAVELPAALKAIDAPLRGPLDPLWRSPRVPLAAIGTDPAAALAAAAAVVDVRATGLGADDVRSILRPALAESRARLARAEAAVASAAKLEPAAPGALEAGLAERRQRIERVEAALAHLDPARVPEGLALAAVGALVRRARYDERGFTAEQRACLDGFGALDLPDAAAAYVARPLAGAWSRGPFLHNGSVPTLYQLLSPHDERDARFFVIPGAFDPVQVGVDRQAKGDGFWFDTRLPGNSNVGHEFRAGYSAGSGEPQYGVIGPALSADERWALVEYLKVHEDPAEPEGRAPSDCGVR